MDRRVMAVQAGLSALRKKKKSNASDFLAVVDLAALGHRLVCPTVSNNLTQCKIAITQGIQPCIPRNEKGDVNENSVFWSSIFFSFNPSMTESATNTH